MKHLIQMKVVNAQRSVKLSFLCTSSIWIYLATSFLLSSAIGWAYHNHPTQMSVCGWVGTFVRMCVSTFLFTLGLLPRTTSLRGWALSPLPFSSFGCIYLIQKHLALRDRGRVQSHLQTSSRDASASVGFHKLVEGRPISLLALL